MLYNYRIIAGDALEKLRELPSESVHCAVTSPPYYGLRDYGTAEWEGGEPGCDHIAGMARGDTERETPGGRGGSFRGGAVQYRHTCPKCGARRIDKQLGLEDTPAAYVARLVDVFREVRRVLRRDGVVFLNLGDSYATSSAGNKTPSGPQQRSAAARSGSLAQYGGPKRTTIVGNLKPKDLIGIPWRTAFALQDDGWWLRQGIVWEKDNPMPESVRDRCTTAHEFVFILTKAARYFWDGVAIAEPSTGQGGAAANFKRSTKDHLIPGQSTIQHREDREPTFDNGTRNRRSVWHFPTAQYSGAHFAVMPLELAQTCIRAGTSEHGCCPACGAPWRRVVGRVKPPEIARSANAKRIGMIGRNDNERRLGQQLQDFYNANPPTTIGWRPTCKHYPRTNEWLSYKRTDGSNLRDDIAENERRRAIRAELVDFWKKYETDPCIVLDPFGGRGTTVAAAIDLGRNGIMIELNEDYTAMARDYISSVTPLFATEV
jgi:DNA modification methylase